MALLSDIVGYLDTELRTSEIPDYSGALNGLQLANRGTVKHVAAAVDFSTVGVRAAVDRGADMLVVHHGMFWNGPAAITGPAYERLSLLLQHGIAVYGSHIPLDLHPVFGNNPLLAQQLGLQPTGGFAMARGVYVGVSGSSHIPTMDIVTRAREFCTRHNHHLVTTPVAAGQVTKKWAICTGAGASAETLKEAKELGVDTLIVGEGPHHTAVQAVDEGLTILYAGHYATETLGVVAITNELARRFSITASFIEASTGL
jgi:dinuclear metal center YbgI/SA1388 family protein